MSSVSAVLIYTFIITYILSTNNNEHDGTGHVTRAW